MTGYQALREAVAWLDLDNRGRFRARGDDRVRLLHAMSTAHIQRLQPGESSFAFFLNAQGRIVGSASIVCFKEHHLLDTEPANHDELFQHLDKFIIADDVALEDARQDMFAIGIEGPNAPPMVETLAGVKSIYTVTGAPGARIYGPVEEKPAVIAQLEAAGAVAATAEETEIVRLENFRPRYGADITAKHLVHETQLLSAVHFSKGCYIGQEIVERVRARGQVHRLLVPLYVEGQTPPPPGTAVLAGEENAGETMSSGFSPALGKSIAFAYLRSQHAAPDTALTVGGAPATVAAAKGI